MHLHATNLNPAALNLYPAAAQQAAQRAAEVRKKLIAGAAQIEGEMEPDKVSMIEDSPDDSSQQQRKHLPTPKNQTKDDEEDPDDPMSTWA